MLGFYVVLGLGRADNGRADNGNSLFDIAVQTLFVSFVNIGQLQLFWLLYQMPYIYWWLMKNYSMTPTNMYTISQLNDRCSELLF